MKASPRIRLNPDQLAALLAGKPLAAVRHDGTLPQRGESYPVTLVETWDRGYKVERTEVGAIVTGSKLRPGCSRSWRLDLLLDHSTGAMNLNAESAGGVIIPMGETHDQREARAHGYVDQGDPLDAGGAIPHADVMASEETQAAAERWASSRVTQLARRRARSLSKRLEDTLVKASAEGRDPSQAIAVVEEQIQALTEGGQAAA